MLVGTILITLSSLALGTIVIYMASQNTKAQSQSSALALQSEVVAALSRDQTILTSDQSSTVRQIARGEVSAGSSIEGVPLKTLGGLTIAVSGQRTFLDLNFQPCDPRQVACPLSVDLALRCSSAVGCQAAYRVSVAQKAGAVTTAALGAPLRGNTP